ncbi:MAG: hypothetical protein COB37_05750 [Kordiimonadales bacterium]|nr:MAG: hypothetical protein COB37_05750 [Kordiimonadales bacterium]
MAEKEVENEGGSGKVFLVLGLLLGLGLGGGGVYFYFGQDDTAVEGEQGAAKKVVKEETFPVEFKRLAVQIFRTSRSGRRRLVGNYFIDLQVNVFGEDNQITVIRSRAQIQHAFLAVISRSELMREDSPTELDHDKTVAVLKKRADELLGAGIVESVTIMQSMVISN